MTEQKGQPRQPWWHETPDELEDENPAGVGTAAQEAVRLAAAVASWASRSGLTDTMKGIAEQTAVSVRSAAAKATSTGEYDDDAEVEVDGEVLDAELIEEIEEEAEYVEYAESTCEYCPVCQGMALLRGVSPEAADGMAEALAAVTDAVKQAVEGMAAGSDSGTKVEHIDVE